MTPYLILAAIAWVVTVLAVAHNSARPVATCDTAAMRKACADEDEWPSPTYHPLTREQVMGLLDAVENPPVQAVYYAPRWAEGTWHVGRFDNEADARVSAERFVSESTWTSTGSGGGADEPVDFAYDDRTSFPVRLDDESARQGYANGYYVEPGADDNPCLAPAPPVEAYDDNGMAAHPTAYEVRHRASVGSVGEAGDPSDPRPDPALPDEPCFEQELPAAAPVHAAGNVVMDPTVPYFRFQVEPRERDFNGPVEPGRSFYPRDTREHDSVKRMPVWYPGGDVVKGALLYEGPGHYVRATPGALGARVVGMAVSSPGLDGWVSVHLYPRES